MKTVNSLTSSKRLIGLTSLYLVAALFAAEAQVPSSVKLPVGNGKGEIGVVAVPNQDCRGPTAIAPSPDGRLALLDKLNHKVVLADLSSQSALFEFALPEYVREPVDIAPTESGFIVAGAEGHAALFSIDGIELARAKSDYDPELGAARLVASVKSGFQLENLFGQRSDLSFPDGQNASHIKAYATADFETFVTQLGNGASIAGLPLVGLVEPVLVTSAIRITGARVHWVDPSKGALIALQERRRFPREASFLRLVKLDPSGIARAEAYLHPAAFGCDAVRPYTQLTDGTVVALDFSDITSVVVQRVELKPIGEAAPVELAASSSTKLIADSADIFSFLEQLNGTPSYDKISLSSVSRQTILTRARAALEYEWTLNSANYSHENVVNKCDPEASLVWQRPDRLNGLVDKKVKAVPYRWGGYAKSLPAFESQITRGDLAGDECTCRKEPYCIQPNAVGMDCSGFVSFALVLNNYFTTRSLGDGRVTSPVTWAQLAPGDIVNRSGRHVRLVESIADGPQGRVITTIESAVESRCGGICRNSYSEADLASEGYVPLRRLNLTD
jgi:hypothetical protein